MPELPEVAMYQKYFHHTALHKKVTDVEVEDERVILLAVDKLRASLKGNTFESTDRIGKYLFIRLSNNQYLSMHFGMTGRLIYFKDKEDTPRFTKVLFFLDDGFHLAFVCPRILGRVGITDEPQAFGKKKKLGQDALKISREDFVKKISGKKGLIKPILMNQRTVAGLGNWIVDDMLYQAGIHPETVASQLGEAQVSLLFDKMQYIIKTAIDNEARYDDFPAHFLITHRNEGAKSNLYDGHIERMVVGGRGTYICPAGQVLK
ncbi:formamidopyrimidine-DNA glycosylase [Catalinimonas alkaloidigena]|uniref:DNA-formamidopyrimidine glycosylase family protein n=1 Tax=Catalinimonas alkaloidigena TaxID=1075417 RepID=UPI002406B912|nr:DNA-formamidopyrimidine glycosylase family protein [Catalinimonas alkaloidigena]MDF9800008.1 formamidopyrimidine-DNA glycosylase [Catalinimonas alkaloidigena]